MGEAQGMSNERQRWPAAPGGRPAPQGATGSTGISPIKAFAGLVALLIAAGTLLLLTRPDASDRFTAMSTAEGDNFALTDAEAEKRFLQLRRQAVVVARTRDKSLLPLVFTNDGPAIRNASSAVEELLDDRVLDRTWVKTLNLDVITNSSSVIVVREKSTLEPCFVSEKGEDVTKDSRSVVQVVDWTLRRQETWLIHDAVLKADRVLNRSSECG